MKCFFLFFSSFFFSSPHLLTTLSFENESFPTGWSFFWCWVSGQLSYFTLGEPNFVSYCTCSSLNLGLRCFNRDKITAGTGCRNLRWSSCRYAREIIFSGWEIISPSVNSVREINQLKETPTELENRWCALIVQEKPEGNFKVILLLLQGQPCLWHKSEELEECAQVSAVGHHCPDGIPLLWPDPPLLPEEGDAVASAPFQDGKSGSCSTETEAREDGGLTVARTRAVQTLPIHWTCEPCEIKITLWKYIFIL